MRFWRDRAGSDMAEHIALVGIILAVAGSAVWAVYQAVANRFADILNNL